jgi:hypothetical protein
MGRKSSAKAQARPVTPGEPPAATRRSFTPLLAIAIVAIVIVGLVAFTRRGDDTAPSPVAAQTPATAIVDPPVTAALGPHPQENLPPLPFDSGPPARPPDVVRAVYKFAAEHPEVLSYVPCYCGCEHQGHKGNDDCFVAGRNAKGDVTQWEPHGMT